MSDFETRTCACENQRRSPPGTGMALGAVIGLAGFILALAIWLAGWGILWAFLIWLFAGPCGLVLCAIADRTAQRPSACESGRCRFPSADRLFGRPVNA